MEKKVEKRTQSSEEKDLKALLAMALAAFYDMAQTMNQFAPLVQKMEEVLKLEGTVSDIPELPQPKENKDENAGS